MERVKGIVDRLTEYTLTHGSHTPDAGEETKAAIGPEDDPLVLAQAALMMQVLLKSVRVDRKNVQYLEEAVWQCMRRAARTSSDDADDAMLYLDQLELLDPRWRKTRKHLDDMHRDVEKSAPSSHRRRFGASDGVKTRE